jgi:hypothetical protein
MHGKRLKHWAVAVAMVLIVWGAGFATWLPTSPNVVSAIGFAAATLAVPAIILAIWFAVSRANERPTAQREK